MKFYLVIFFTSFSYLLNAQIQVVSVCPNGNAMFTSDALSTGNNYRWLIDINDGNGFQPVVNNSTFSGAASIDLLISAASTLMYGYKFQCRAIAPLDTVSSKTYILKFGVDWIGGSDTLWQNAANWQCGTIPDANTEVRIHAGSTHYPRLHNNVVCRKVTLDSLGLLTIYSGANLNITGNDPGITLASNVHNLDSGKMILTSDSAMLSQGIYEFTSNNTFPNFKVNDIIAGENGPGFLRKIVSVVKQANKRILQTTQADMEDAFEEAKFGFEMNSDNFNNVSTNAPLSATGSGFSFDLSNKILYENGPLSIKISSGKVELDPNWNMDFEYKNFKIKFFEMSAKNATIKSNIVLDVVASQAITLAQTTDTLASFEKSFTKYIPVWGVPFPVKVVMRIDLISNTSVVLDASVNRKVNFSSLNTVNLGVRYQNSQWAPIYNHSKSTSFDLTNVAGNINADIKASLEPRISFKLYNSAGPYASVGLHTYIGGKLQSPSLDWNLIIAAYLKATVGADVTILGHTLANFSQSWSTDSLIYNAPDTLRRLSGNQQVGLPLTPLTNPLKAIVVNSRGVPISGVPVYFEVTNGGGTVSAPSVLTNAAGVAEVQWTLGILQDSTQRVKATARRGDGTLINGAPIYFTATNMLDTAAVLVSHGRWSAFEGVDADGETFRQMSASYYNGGNCSNVLIGHYREDSLIFTFNANGTGTVKWDYYADDYDILNYSTCATGPMSITSDGYSVQILWQYKPELNAIRVTYSDDIQEFDGGDVIDFVFQTFTSTEMQLKGTGPIAGSWNYKFR